MLLILRVATILLFRILAVTLLIALGFSILMWAYYVTNIANNNLDVALIYILCLGIFFLIFRLPLDEINKKVFLEPLFRLLSTDYSVGQIVILTLKLFILNLISFLPYLHINSLTPKNYKLPQLLPNDFYRP